MGKRAAEVVYMLLKEKREVILSISGISWNLRKKNEAIEGIEKYRHSFLS